ncbi:hypothetical protein A5630_25365 [Mycolicibacterium mucogenicum]|uniref:Uncharacterized protein n=1 Tax=Mycolicibacterium mucogenicum TaxID=56689 RepID=A0A1A3GY34_MYCMU|nr:metallophosphoesterase [Mycolicibacterium mucogenicum]OBJ40283.1 hypothetical protein A5630_25365 [Mycolicibacterium mucogenicum]
MSNVWFTSDLHIGHDLVAQERGFSAEDHSEFLAEQWDSRIDEDDVVWVLGDLSCGKKSDQINALHWIGDRPGRKRLILGNHDGPHPMHRDAYKWTNEYWMVFEHISTAARIRIPRPDGHLTALLSHFPYTGDHSAGDRHVQWRLRDEGQPIIHGHTHSLEKRTYSDPGLSTQIHVGVDAWSGWPVSLDEVAELVNG